MRLAYFDCARGISGGAAFAALVDAGADLDGIRAHLSSFRNIAGLDVAEVIVDGARSRRVLVRGRGEPCRRLSEIEELIGASTLSGRARATAHGIYRRLATAEGRVHGTHPGSVEFHELGSARSIAGVVGTVVALDLLATEIVVSSPVATGRGTVETAHGRLPVPVPAAVELLRGIPIVAGGGDGELVTPTGAAFLAETADSFGPMPEIAVESVGSGAGGAHTPHLLVRVVLGTSDVSAGA